MAAGAETPSGAETRRGGVDVGVPPSTSGTPSTAYLNRARDLAERVQASMFSELAHDPLYSQLASSPATTTFAASRAKEIMDQLIAAGGDAGWRPSGDPRTASLEEGPRSDSHHHRPGGGEETDPSTPTPLRTTTNTAASTTTTEPPTGHPQTPSPTPPTPTEEDPIEALLSKATARGVHLPIVTHHVQHIIADFIAPSTGARPRHRHAVAVRRDLPPRTEGIPTHVSSTQPGIEPRTAGFPANRLHPSIRRRSAQTNSTLGDRRGTFRVPSVVVVGETTK